MGEAHRNDLLRFDLLGKNYQMSNLDEAKWKTPQKSRVSDKS
jgi:hypothetical protein